MPQDLEAPPRRFDRNRFPRHGLLPLRLEPLPPHGSRRPHPHRADFDRIARPRESMPYLYQTGDLHPGFFTLETSRPGTGVLAALGNLLLFGKEGLRAILGHLVEMAEVLREHLEGHAATTVLN